VLGSHIRKPTYLAPRVGRIGGLLFILLGVLAVATTNGSAQTLTTLYSFPGSSDPYAGLILDKSGNLYSTTTEGGANGNGAVYELTPPTSPGGMWTETTLYSFGTNGASDGVNPYAGLIMDTSGNLYRDHAPLVHNQRHLRIECGSKRELHDQRHLHPAVRRDAFRRDHHYR
jgi:hypothetical protein